MIRYEALRKEEHKPNLNNAFVVAERDLGLFQLLDAEGARFHIIIDRSLLFRLLSLSSDVDVDFPDEKSIMTYVVTYYHYFSKMKSEGVGGRRIAKVNARLIIIIINLTCVYHQVIGQVMDNDQLMLDYERFASELLAWIEQKTKDLEDRSFPNSLVGMQSAMAQFNQYRTKEKPPKYVVKVLII